MKRTLIAFSFCLTALAAAPGAAAQEPVIGQVDLQALTAPLGNKPKVNINFGPAMMAGFAETVRAQNPEAAEVLGSISGLRVVVFEDVDTAAVEPQVAEVTGRLARDGWTPALEVRDADAKVDMFLIESGQFVKGLTVLVREAGGTAVFVNVFGNMEPAVIGKLIAQGQALEGLDLGGLMKQLQPPSGAEAAGDDES
ncbi:MAG: DUF4252 domain-containing protein [Wenzhouxiangellaceae bacterium]|nr:DUF4252 domain-containing protein [Wenzhouxiangellaceae bacterium]